VLVEDLLAGQKRSGWDLALVPEREQEVTKAQKVRSRPKIDYRGHRE
jgi:hypothetical protein